VLNVNNFDKYCSEKCMKKHSGYDCDIKNINEYLYNIKPAKSTSNDHEEEKNKKKHDKLQNSIIKEATKLDYALKRESYKYKMRKQSLRKVNSSNSVNRTNIPTKNCRSLTKKGTPCTNKALDNSDYCGILGHCSDNHADAQS
jgi:hypothetical protein